MDISNTDKIKKAFSVQASNFESDKMHLSKKEYIDYAIHTIKAKAADKVLEVASGTCVCGRAFAPLVQSVVCLDTTEAMLNVGRENAEKESLTNIEFVEGNAENLPFDENSFDIVITRLSFHHFINTNKIFEEMYRVLKPNGKLVIIDVEAAEEELRQVEDEIETIRDFSHVKNLSRNEFLDFYIKKSMQIELCESKEIPIKLTAWMELTKTTEENRKFITDMMLKDMGGNTKTGFFPYIKDNEIYFNHHWLMIIGIKF